MRSVPSKLTEYNSNDCLSQQPRSLYRIRLHLLSVHKELPKFSHHFVPVINSSVPSLCCNGISSLTFYIIKSKFSNQILPIMLERAFHQVFPNLTVQSPNPDCFACQTRLCLIFQKRLFIDYVKNPVIPRPSTNLSENQTDKSSV